MPMRNLFCRASLIAAATAGLYALPAQAQDAAATDEAETAATDEGAIVVTARRREETLISVPIAITALTGDQLAAKGAGDITALAETVPNVTLESSRATNSTLSAFIRGVGQQDPVSGFEQGVGIYLDDVYLNRPQAAVLDIYDVERIEVLRGPQGTLYGRNTVGGAIKYVTKRLANDPRLSARATYGSYNQIDGVVSVSAPITSDGVLRVGGALARLTRDGFGTNLTTGLDNYDKDVWAGRGTLEVHGNGIFARVSGDYTHDKSNPRGGHRVIAGMVSGAPVLSNVYDTRGGLNTPSQDVKAWGVSLFLEAEPTDWLTTRSITSYRKDDSATPIDFDALPAADVDVPGYYRNRQFSQELQALVNFGKLNGLVGFYYLDASALTQFDVRLFVQYPSPLLLTAYTNADIGTETMAGFADFTYDFTDQLSLSLGGRYTWDRRDGYILRQYYLGGGSPVFGGAGIPYLAPLTNFRGNSTYTKFTPKATLTFKPDRDTTVYGSYSQGFKGGGFDPRGVGASAPAGVTQAQFLSFKPEQVDSYEVGFKANLFDRRLYIATAAFYMDYKDVQIPGSVPCVAGGFTTFCGVVSNAGKARMKGFEFEGRAKIIDSDAGTLTLSGSVGYIDAKYLQYVTNVAGKPTEVSQYRHVQNTPEWSGSASLDWAMPLADGTLTMGAGMSFKSKTYQFEIANPYLDQPAYQLFDASIVYKAPGGRWSLGVYGKNLTNERYRTSGYTYMAVNATTGQIATPMMSALGLEGILTTFYGNPRQVFATATVNF
ncbi:iron complex outermembrane receptor protein [Novosphingobium kunmingense]|uniref:Iron complex outermembrane receptor protein n=1 Tax=Novosphingobium kunmingense TaxID=1211806 RepID=A0A2N0H6S0_9SPHN|nr:TonB-dependent receptor [Novosphingobium kunmingense]PKB14643.1 iron complex outermembrane receptor protein [Novosphingobium kunmingense]